MYLQCIFFINLIKLILIFGKFHQNPLENGGGAGRHMDCRSRSMASSPASSSCLHDQIWKENTHFQEKLHSL